jgi:hypothetical protein
MTPSASHLNRRSLALVVAGVICASALVRSHEVPVEQVVEMTVQPQGDRLSVRAHIPATLLASAKLPRLADGTLDAASDAPLRMVAADAARNLDVWQDETALTAPEMTARTGADRVSVDVDLLYATNSGAAPFSARLNAFEGAPLQPARTIVRYVPPGGAAQTISVTGPPARVVFDPGVFDVAGQFVTRALTAVLTAGDHLLWLVCLLLPFRDAARTSRLVGSMVAAQSVAILLFAFAPAAASSIAPVASTIAASALVMAALQNIVRAREHWVIALTASFGLLNGLTFGGVLAAERQFGGSHQAIVLATFVLSVALGQLWVAAVFWAARAWIAKSGMPDRVAIIAASALVAHTGIHRMLDRGHALVQDGGFVGARMLLWLTLSWAFVMLLIAIGELIKERRGAVPGDRLRGHAQR